MAKLLVSQELTDKIHVFDAPVQKSVAKLIAKFRVDHRQPSIHLEKINGQRDPRARTVRVDDFWRGVVASAGEGVYILVDVLAHDDAIDWVKRREFRVNQVTGALEIVDLVRVQEAADEVAATDDDQGGYFESRRDKDFVQLGVDENFLPLIRAIRDEEALLSLAELLPEKQADAVLLLADGLSVEDAWAQLVADHEPGDVDTDDLAAAATSPISSDRFQLLEDDEDLARVLSDSFEAWQRYLHPTQESWAYRSRFNGPARMLGGPGTGKTVVAVHRTRFLAERLEESGTSRRERILLTTFTRNLAANLERLLVSLAGPDITDQVEVANIDSVAARIVRDAEGRAPRWLSTSDERQVWQDLVDETGAHLEPEFLAAEHEHVILAHDVQSRRDYLRVRRHGRGAPLHRKTRMQVWDLVEAFLRRLDERSERTPSQIVQAAAGHAADRQAAPYQHVIVDEAQDFSAPQWRLVRQLVRRGNNDIFLVGDAHQRIYDHRISLSSLDIEIRGRARRLTLNYRTTQQILRWTLQLLEGPFDDLDGGRDTLAGYRSRRTGPPPELLGYDSLDAELDATAEAAVSWLEDGIEPSAIGVAVRTHEREKQVLLRLEKAGIDAVVIRRDSEDLPDTAVRVATMHRMKGTEFRAVAIVDASKDAVPDLTWIVNEETDPVQHHEQLQRERCLLYVAGTRARDVLRASWHGEKSPFLPG